MSRYNAGLMFDLELVPRLVTTDISTPSRLASLHCLVVTRKIQEYHKLTQANKSMCTMKYTDVGVKHGPRVLGPNTIIFGFRNPR